VREDEVGAGVKVAGVQAEVRVRMQVGAGVSVGAIGRHRTRAPDMYRIAHHDLFHDHLSNHVVAAYRQTVWIWGLRVEKWGTHECSYESCLLYIEALLLPHV